MSSFLGNLSNIASGNPFVTDVGQRIERATDGSLASEDWSANMEVCDIINDTEEGAKDAVRAIRKRLQTNAGKNHTVVMYTLTLLETCVKNCGRKFHILVASKDFCQELVKIIQPKNDPPQVVQEKVLSLIQTWSDAFHGQHDLKGANEVYNELKTKGIEFPMTDLDALSPIHTPAAANIGHTETDAAARRASGARSQAVTQPAQHYHMAPPQQQQPYSPATAAPDGQQGMSAVASVGVANLSPDQLAKLRSELDIVAGNTRVFSDMLTQLNALDVKSEDLQLLQELNSTCREMQSRIVHLINTVSNEEVTEELLRVNDDLNNLFIRYDRFERYRTGRAGQDPDDARRQQQQSIGRLPPPSGSAGAVRPKEEPSLIQFTDEPAGGGPVPGPGLQTNPDDIQVQLAGLTMAEGGGQSTVSGALNAMHSNVGATGASGSTYADNTNIDQHSGLATALNRKTNEVDDINVPVDKEGDYDEMEKWLSEKTATSATESNNRMTSSEFDKFLADRAAAADRLPSANPAAPAGATTTNTQTPQQQPQKDENDSSLFGL